MSSLVDGDHSCHGSDTEVAIGAFLKRTLHYQDYSRLCSKVSDVSDCRNSASETNPAMLTGLCLNLNEVVADF